MPADLTKPFGESCCDGGECSTSKESAQYCGCDMGLKTGPHYCQRHLIEIMIKEANESARESS